MTLQAGASYPRVPLFAPEHRRAVTTGIRRHTIQMAYLRLAG